MHKEKDTLRKINLNIRKALTHEQCDSAEKYIAATFWETIPQEVAVLHTYIPINKEASTLLIIEKALQLGWKVIVPQTLPNRKLRHLVLHDLFDLEEEKFKTLVPKVKEEYDGTIDYVLVPGVAFSLQKGRMGYGGGYYDTFLAEHKEAYKIGVAYAYQMTDSLPLEEHDVTMDSLIIAPM